MSTPNELPQTITDVAHLEDLLSAPSAGVVETLARLPGDILVLGAAGKMGPTLSRMARRATDAAGIQRRVIAVSRFSSPGQEAKFHAAGVETIQCDLLDPAQLARLPDAPNIVYMAGMKFGATGQEALTWALNAHLPALVCRRFPASRVAAFSTGNVYDFVPTTSSGSREIDAPNPRGEYAMSCLGRERIFEHFSRAQGTPVSLLRLNYAVEMRYGVLVDIAQKVFEGRTVDVTMGYANVIWQGEANAMALQALGHAASPPLVVNIAGPEIISVRQVAEKFARRFGKAARLSGAESKDALLSNGERGYQLFGRPRVTVDQMIAWIADWIARGGESLGKPTHFETRDGKF
ncbi:MAG: NAD(P)-dependent oxidoreductase [Verrucomicrobiae bacterium]|nr:NAD(P)-dependent oxidoreductase [Verrucomicrobiae bacterium]